MLALEGCAFERSKAVPKITVEPGAATGASWSWQRAPVQLPIGNARTIANAGPERSFPDGHACGMLPVDILWISAMAGTAIERASSLIRHWERRFEVCRLNGQSRLRPGTETCAKWTAFLRKFEAKLSALRMRRDVLVALDEAAQLDTVSIGAAYADETINPEVAERFAAAFAENERRLASVSETDSS